jgi:D-threo-aldose 1-dehydrogenase
VNEVDICLELMVRVELDVLLLAGRYTLLEQGAIDQLLPRCVTEGVSVVIGGPFNSGILATGAHPLDGAIAYFNYEPATPPIIERVAAIEAVCDAYGVSLRAAALQFPLAHPAVVAVLAGARSIAELDDNLRLARAMIPATFWSALHDERLVAPDAPLPAGS